MAISSTKWEETLFPEPNTPKEKKFIKGFWAEVLPNPKAGGVR